MEVKLHEIYPWPQTTLKFLTVEVPPEHISLYLPGGLTTLLPLFLGEKKEHWLKDPQIFVL